MEKLTKLIWSAVQIIPKHLRARISRSAYLSAWYTRMLRSAGMHPSVNLTMASRRSQTLSDIENDPNYKSNIEYQSNIINRALQNTIPLPAVSTVVIIVDNWNGDECAKTLHSVNQQSLMPEHIVVLCKPTEQKLVQSHFQTAQWLMQNITVLTSLKQMSRKQSSNSAFVCFQSEKLHVDCLAMLSHKYSAQNKANTIDIAYVDTDYVRADQRLLPEFYPDWNPDLHLSTAYISSGIYLNKAELFKGLTPDALTCSDIIKNAYLDNQILNIKHIPLVLLHKDHQKLLIDKPVKDTSEYFELQQQPLVSLIVPTYNGEALVRACVESILENTRYTHYEILLVDNNSDNEEALAYFEMLNEHPKIKVLKYPHPFNYSAINNFAVRHSNGSVIGLVNNDIEVIEGDWLEKMVTHVRRPDIGCVGAKLLYSNGLVQHAGVVMGYGGGAGHAHKYFRGNDRGYLNRALATQNYSAVTAACLLVEKADFQGINGLNETDLTVAFNDVDFCLRLLKTGKRNLLCAEAVLYHHESVSRGDEDTSEKKKRFLSEVEYLQTTWASYIAHDPAYNPNLTLRYENFTINTELSD